jgi:hypothetical protein
MFKRNWRTAVSSDTKPKQPKVLWYAEVTDEMITHLSPSQRNEFMNKLSEEIDKIGREYQVGKEFKNGQLKENNYA